MDSHDFFFNNFTDKNGMILKEKFNNKTGIYVIEQPVIKFQNQRVFKVGMADAAGLTRRLADYTTAYGPQTFVIHLLWAIPKVINGISRLNYNVEQHLHKSLIESNKQAGPRAKEWFVDLSLILAYIYKIKNAFEERLQIDGKKSQWYFEDFTNINVRLKRAIKLSNPENILIKTPKGYSDIFVIDRNDVRREADKERRYLSNEIYIKDRRATIGLYNENRKMYQITFDIPRKGDKKYMDEDEIRKYKPTYK